MIEELFAGPLEEEDKIVDVKVVGFKEAFRNPDAIPAERKKRIEGRKFVLITTEKGVNEAHMIPKGLEYESGWKVVDKLSAIRGLRNPASWFRRFYIKYKSLPVPGLKVKVTLNERGFLRIVV